MIRLDRKSEPNLAQEPPTLFKSYEQMWPAEFFNSIGQKRPELYPKVGDGMR